MHYCSCFSFLCEMYGFVFIYRQSLILFLVSSGIYNKKPYKNSVLKEIFGFHQCNSIVNSYVTVENIVAIL